MRPAALENRRFRTVLLAVAGVPIVLLYAWQAIVLPIFFAGYLGDFQESYMRAAGRIAAGLDPYDLCATMGCSEPTGPQYVMPPVLAWLLQPLVGVSPSAITVGAILVLNASLAVFVWSMLRALAVRDRQVAALLVLMTLAFEPVLGNIAEGQVNPVLLGLSGLWFLAWVERRWWGGVPLGAEVALKLIQAPVGLLVLWSRRWSMLGAAIAAGLALWLAGAPRYLFEYLTKVLPAVSAGTGLFENHSPGGTITRLIDPATFAGEPGSPPAARLLTVAVAVAVLVATFAVLRHPSAGRGRTALEAAAVVAATPLVASYSWGTHLILLLLPMYVLVAWALPRRRWPVLALVAVSWLLIGPAHKLMQALLVGGYGDLVVLRVLAEAGVIGVSALWVACLLAVRSSPDRADARDEDGADREQHDRTRERDAVAGVR